MDFSIERNYEISEEAAKDQLIKMMEYYDFDLDDLSDESDKKQIEQNLKKIIRMIRSGKLEVVDEDSGKPYFKQTVKSGDEIHYSGSLSTAKSSTDGLSANARHAIQYAFMGSLCGLGSKAIKKLEGPDYVCMEVVSGFLLSVAL